MTIWNIISLYFNSFFFFKNKLIYLVIIKLSFIFLILFILSPIEITFVADNTSLLFETAYAEDSTSNLDSSDDDEDKAGPLTKISFYSIYFGCWLSATAYLINGMVYVGIGTAGATALCVPVFIYAYKKGL